MNDPLESYRASSGVFFSLEGKRGNWEVKLDNQECDQRLSALLTDNSLGPSGTLQSILALGTDWLGVENGYLTRIDPADGTRTITDACGPHPAIYRGATTDLSRTFCRAVLAESRGLAIENAPEQGWESDAAYETYGFSSYIGAKVVVDGELRGTVCFTDRAPRTDPFDESDAAIVALLVRAVVQTLASRRQADRIRQTSARLEVLFEESPNMINIHDGDGNLIVPNPRLCEKTGYAATELAQMKVWDLDEQISPDEAYDLWSAMEPGDRRRLEGRYQKKEEAAFPVEVDLRCLELNGALRYVAIARDITDRRQREQELARAKRKAEDADRLKSAILANMNHEVQTPLTSIMVSSEILEARLEGRSQALAARIRRVSKRLENTLDSVLGLSRLDNGDADLPRERVALDSVVRDVAGALSGDADDGRPGVVVDLPDSPVTGLFNEDALHYICQNLMENAVKFTSEAGTVELRVREEENDGILEIEDSGIGMRPERVTELFEDFGRVSEEGPGDCSGRGLGLPIVKRFVHALDGTIEVDTERGEGTCVTVRLPKDKTISKEGQGVSAPK